MFKTLARFLAISGSNRSGLIRSFGYSFIQSVFEVLPAGAIVLTVTRVIEDAGGRRAMTQADLGLALALMLISLAGRIVFGQLSLKAKGEANYRLFAERRLHIGDLLKRVPLGYFNKNTLGEISAAVTTTMTDVENVAVGMLDKMISGLAHTAAISSFLLFYNWRVGLISLIGLAVSLFVYGRIQKKSGELAHLRQAAQAELAAAALEYIQGLAVVKAFGLEQRAGKALTEAIEASRQTNTGMERGLNWLTAAYQLIFKAAAGLVMLTAGLLFSGGRLSLPECIFLIIASFMIYARMEVMGSVSAVLRLVETSLDRLEAVEKAPAVAEGRRKATPESFNLEFRDVTFGYGRQPVLKRVSFHIPQKARTAVVGPSGSGKTTLCNLMARFWDVDEGSVFLGGVDIRDYTVDGLLKNISMVFQNVYLFNDTIRNNILFGRPDATQEEVTRPLTPSETTTFLPETSPMILRTWRMSVF